ncbi:MAG: glutamate-5-semialdehyde dehydrogenase [Alphaproteobacteria bacterium]
MTNDISTIALEAKKIATKMAQVSSDAKNNCLKLLAKKLLAEKNAIISANQIDVKNGKDLTPALQDRLWLDEKRITAIAEQVITIAELPDPVGKVLDEWQRPNGLSIKKIACPLGVVLAIYESRPNVSIDISALTLKSGNVAILRGGTASKSTSQKLLSLMSESLKESRLPILQTQMVMADERSIIGELLKMKNTIDVVVPRGGKALINYVKANATMPVFAHEDGNCHIYVDGDADIDMATHIINNAKLRRVGICGAMETLLVDKKIASYLGVLLKPLIDAGVEFRACEISHNILGQENIKSKLASDEDYFTEFLDKILAIKMVDGVAQAIDHINHYGSHHTDAIISASKKTAMIFLTEVNSAIVLHNASTQFADGGEFGFGAEVGVATGKFHARGPVGLKELCSYYYQVFGDGQCRP